MASAALFAAGTAGRFNVYVLNDTHVIIDVNGWFGQSLLWAPVSLVESHRSWCVRGAVLRFHA
jgi:hypothetical protein